MLTISDYFDSELYIYEDTSRKPSTDKDDEFGKKVKGSDVGRGIGKHIGWSVGSVGHLPGAIIGAAVGSQIGKGNDKDKFDITSRKDRWGNAADKHFSWKNVGRVGMRGYNHARKMGYSKGGSIAQAYGVGPLHAAIFTPKHVEEMKKKHENKKK